MFFTFGNRTVILCDGIVSCSQRDEKYSQVQ